MNNPKASRPFTSARSLAQIVIILLAICALIDAVAIAIAGNQSIGTLQLVARFTAFIVFLIWFYRAHRNLQALGIRRGRYSSPWSILLFLVPILNLYYAYDLVKELWRQSSPDLGFSDAFLKQHAFALKHYPSKTPLVGLWWGFTIASVLAARIFDHITGTWMDLTSDALAVVASILLILIIRETDARQEEKRRRLTLDAVTRKAIDLVVATEFSRAASSKN
jgi:Ca2+/Na+ antiporter